LRNSGLYRAAISLRRSATGSRTLWGKADSIALPDSGQRQVGVALIVTVPTASYLAVGFIWQPEQTTDPQRVRRLELLAKALGLVSARWRKDEEHAARRRHEHRTPAELQHRLRNNLALLRSIIRRSHETAESAEHFALHLETRIGALTRMQGALAAARSDGMDLEDLVRTELIASAVVEQRYLVEGPAVRVHDKCAELLALVVHELAINSLKFGALAASSGRLAIRWGVAGGPSPRLQLSWVESGVSIASAAPRRRGFGQELIECTLPYELGAHSRLAFSPGGVTCEIHIPLEECSVEPAAQAAAHGGGSW
jgi:two-component sensor histidine kinase